MPTLRLVFGITTTICGVLVAAMHDEWPLLAYSAGACSAADYAYECSSRSLYGAAAGVGTVVLMGGLLVVLHRYVRIPPTLTCRRCGTSGWALDIEPHGGSCPHCGGDRFDYRIWFAGGNGLGPRLERVREDDVAGAELVRRFRETRTSWTRRYY